MRRVVASGLGRRQFMLASTLLSVLAVAAAGLLTTTADTLLQRAVGSGTTQAAPALQAPVGTTVVTVTPTPVSGSVLAHSAGPLPRVDRAVSLNDLLTGSGAQSAITRVLRAAPGTTPAVLPEPTVAAAPLVQPALGRLLSPAFRLQTLTSAVQGDVPDDWHPQLALPRAHPAAHGTKHGAKHGHRADHGHDHEGTDN